MAWAHGDPSGRRRRWLLCPHCGGPSVIDGHGVQSPAPLAGAAIDGLPSDVERAWTEARITVGAGAFTAGALLCRKILMHVAVDVANATEGLTFQAYIDALGKAGYVTPPMEQWVQLIRGLGNDATHKLPEIDEHRGLSVMTFTEQLLRMSYGMSHLTGRFTSPPPTTAVADDQPAAEE